MKSPVVKRSIVVAGHKTSVSLEEAFWNGMKEISGTRDMTLSELVERTIQSVDLVLASVVDKIRVEVSADGDVERLYDKRFQLFLSEKISGLPQIDSLGVVSDASSMRSTPSGACATGCRRSRRIQSRHRFNAIR